MDASAHICIEQTTESANNQMLWYLIVDSMSLFTLYTLDDKKIEEFPYEMAKRHRKKLK